MKIVILVLLVVAIMAAVLLVRTINLSNEPIGALYLAMNDEGEIVSMHLALDSDDAFKSLKRHPWATFKVHVIHNRTK